MERNIALDSIGKTLGFFRAAILKQTLLPVLLHD